HHSASKSPIHRAFFFSPRKPNRNCHRDKYELADSLVLRKYASTAPAYFYNQAIKHDQDQFIPWQFAERQFDDVEERKSAGPRT
ncbi:MAG TPA: hypothetical protein QF520_10365, partial [SAR202 cluster bacterium]|nr:hypothetical protein [SAR202 cluster bacterium]